jgi:hypothetical protein
LALAKQEVICPCCGGHLQIEYIQFRSDRHASKSKGPPARGAGQLSLPV